MATLTVEDIPPLFEPTNITELVSVDDSKITNVSLYAGRAEITRLYRFPVKTGQNQVNINGLPNVMDRESLRVEGRGAATIHDVTISVMTKPDPVIPTSASIDELLVEKELANKGMERCKKALASLEAYLSTMNVQHTDASSLDQVIERYDQTAEKLDRKIIDLEKSVERIDARIETQRKELMGVPPNDRLGLRAAIGVFAAFEGEVEIALIYAVNGATWRAAYDVRVDMQAKEKPVRLIYKAVITQDTGEAWDDVPLSLETASPTFGMGIPKLFPWTVSLYKPLPRAMKKSMASALMPSPLKSVPAGSASRSARRFSSLGGQSMIRGMQGVDYESEWGGGVDFDISDGGEGRMDHRGLSVSSKGGISATFRVPGTITVPSDGASHNVTVVQLELDASMSWVTIPKIDPKTHLKAKIKNASDYTLLAGSASVYVDGSFISRSDVPLVSPQESFDCPLGLDPSIRVVYHPRSKKASQTGFYSKTSNLVFSQRITVFNTKSTAIDNFKVIDQLPISEHSQIIVKLISPSLSIPELENDGTERKVPPAVKVSEGVLAQWEGTDEQGFDLEALGKDGKFNWICSVPTQGKVNLQLSWEVNAPLRTDIVGL